MEMERAESRVFPAVAVVALPIILALLPSRYQLMPREVAFVGAVALAVPMLLAGISSKKEAAWRAERYVAAVVLPLTVLVSLVVLALLLRDMASKHPGISGLTLLTTSIGIWVTNILVFALAYWLIDRGGPEGRSMGWRGRSDFTFPRGDPSDNFPANWQPIFADYLALAFNTSAAFSPTDVLPLTPRAKMLMVLQSAISLVTVIAVGARAINLLGS
jgi:uncharacterized membrane protein